MPIERRRFSHSGKAVSNHTGAPATAVCCALPATLKKDGAVLPGVDDPDVYTNGSSGDFLADAKISWRDAYDLQSRTAIRPLAQAAE